MPRAVLDSSVLVSAFLTPRGLVARLLHAPMLERYRLCLSEPILVETAEVLLTKLRLRRMFAYTDGAVSDYIRWLGIEAEMVANIPRLRVVAADPKDDPILATAVAAKADHLVTGDRAHLLPIGEYEGVRIVSPRAFLEYLT